MVPVLYVTYFYMLTNLFLSYTHDTYILYCVRISLRKPLLSRWLCLLPPLHFPPLAAPLAVARARRAKRWRTRPRAPNRAAVCPTRRRKEFLPRLMSTNCFPLSSGLIVDYEVFLLFYLTVWVLCWQMGGWWVAPIKWILNSWKHEWLYFSFPVYLLCIIVVLILYFFLLPQVSFVSPGPSYVIHESKWYLFNSMRASNCVQTYLISLLGRRMVGQDRERPM